MTGIPADVAAELAALANVSRETLERLELLVARLLEWQRGLNLIGASTIPYLWRRHVLDSAQLLPLIEPRSTRLVDLGSGAGFPGLVLAILGARGVELIEADQRKCAFLRDAGRATDAGATVVHVRLDGRGLGRQADTITARALARLPRLLALAHPFVHAGTRCLFLKGATLATELTEAHKIWKMRFESVPSRTDPGGRVVVIEGLSHGSATRQSGRTT